MEDVKLAQDLENMLDRFRQAGTRMAADADFRQVLDAFGDFEEEKDQVRDSRAGTVYPDSASVESIFLATRESADTVEVLQMHFKEGITLSALEAELGAWYRDPPEPAELAFTSAYFNPRLIDPAATFLLKAVVDEFCDRFTPQTIVNSLNIDYSDDRQVTDRPW